MATGGTMRRMGRHRLKLVATCGVAMAAVLTGSVAPVVGQVAPDTGAAVVLQGRGWGHGVGMAQDGARSMGAEGASASRILSTFYPGTSVTSRSGSVRVAVLLASSNSVVLAFPDGGEIRQRGATAPSAAFPFKVPPGSRVLIRHDGSYRAELLAPPSGSAQMQIESASIDRSGVVLASVTRPVIGAAQVASSTTAPPTTLTGNPPASAPPRTLVPRTSTTAPRSLPRSRLPPSTVRTLVPRRSNVPQASTTIPANPARPAARPPSPRVLDQRTSTLPLEVEPGAGSVKVETRDRRYRGRLEATMAPGGLRLVNVVDVETYLRGMGEVRDASWPAAGLQTQAVAARTYALRAMDKVGEICDDDRCQVYLGAQAEYPEMDRAVADTAGQVLSFNGELATAVYSANAGGYTATPQEGFGSLASARPYLQANRYATRDPMAWKVQAPLAEIGRRLAYPGRLTKVEVIHTGPSGRVLELALNGDAGPRAVPGVTAASRLGLRSNLFAIGGPVGGPSEGLGPGDDPLAGGSFTDDFGLGGGGSADSNGSEELVELLDGFGLDGSGRTAANESEAEGAFGSTGPAGAFGSIDVQGLIQRLPDDVPRGFSDPSEALPDASGGGATVVAAPAGDFFARWGWEQTVAAVALVALLLAVLRRRELAVWVLRRSGPASRG